MKATRRDILQSGAALLAASSFEATIDKALAIPANARTGTIRDVEHVVVLMQENRSFDHYFGAMRGVRGFNDPRAISLPGGAPVWRQPDGAGGSVAPFRLDARQTSAEVIESLDHSWKGTHAKWKHHDAWIPEKTPMTMGYFTREDLPFYYALADAFTICDAYHCSIWGPTNPNRLYLFTGTNGLTLGQSGPLAVRNPILELNVTSDPKNDGRHFRGFNWTTYAERLQAAGVDWKVYQEYDNYGDNALAYFKQFRGAGMNETLRAKARSWPASSNAENAVASRGEHVIADFANDVRGGRLPAVSWIVAPYIMSEHPKAGPSYGQSFVARLLEALVANPDVWSKTVFLLNYDENDGFFDHAPPHVPAAGTAPGASTVDLTGEVYRGEPVGLGPRVPMLIVSPWSKGGWVNSQVFDHTSVLQFIERRFGVMEPNISAWRRCVCGDLSSAFDFAAPDNVAATLPNTSGYIAAADATEALPKPVIPHQFETARQEPGQRPARALPYTLDVQCALDSARKQAGLTFVNAGAAGAGFNVYSSSSQAGPWFFTVEAAKRLNYTLQGAGETYDYKAYGPNGFLRAFSGGYGAAATRVEASAAYDAATQSLVITLRNDGATSAAVAVRARAYAALNQDVRLAPQEARNVSLPIAASSHWYDIEITSAGDSHYTRRLAGHWETGAPSASDPLLGQAEPA